MSPQRSVALLVPLVALVAAGLAAQASPSGPGSPAHPAQATPVPPIATCAPAPPGSTTTPPGLYPRVSIDEVVIQQEFDDAGCPGLGMVLSIPLRNDGPSPSGPFAVRVDGCGVGLLERTVDDVDMFQSFTLEIPGAQVPPGPCAIMLEPSCQRNYFDRHWSGPVPHPAPLPTCTPGPSPTTTTSATATDAPTDRPTATPTARPVLLPRLGGMSGG